MTAFMVIEIKDGQTEGHGRREFAVVPVKGDYIELPDRDGKAHMYEVIRRVHPAEPATTAGDLFVRHRATTAAEFLSWLSAYEAAGASSAAVPGTTLSPLEQEELKVRLELQKAYKDGPEAVAEFRRKYSRTLVEFDEPQEKP